MPFLAECFPVTDALAADLRDFFPATFELSMTALVLSILIGLPIALLNLDEKPMMVVFLGAVALGWLASGAWTLRSYLSYSHPDGEVTE